jgi:hypothetical protein
MLVICVRFINLSKNEKSGNLVTLASVPVCEQVCTCVEEGLPIVARLSYLCICAIDDSMSFCELLPVLEVCFESVKVGYDKSLAHFMTQELSNAFGSLSSRPG